MVALGLGMLECRDEDSTRVALEYRAQLNLLHGTGRCVY